jgi:hypothetical protein
MINLIQDALARANVRISFSFSLFLELSARYSRCERKLDLSSAIIYPISWLLVIRVDVRKPANTTSHHVLQVLAMLIQKGEISLGHRLCDGVLIEGVVLTCSLEMLATALGLFGLTLEEVTEGQPFWWGVLDVAHTFCGENTPRQNTSSSRSRIG